METGDSAPETTPLLRVNHGVHTGTHQVVGMTVAQARRLLSPFMNIDPAAVAVIGGEIVEDEDARVLLEADEMVNFVKKSSVKGAGTGSPARRRKGPPESIVLENATATLHLEQTSPQSLPASDVVEVVQAYTVQGMTDAPLAETVRWKIVCGGLTIFLIELEPQLRWIRWLSPQSPAPLGDEAVYIDYRLATPFVVMKVPILRGRIHHKCEVFFRNEPLKSLDDELFYSNLLNVSPGAYDCVAWFCTQHLDHELKLLQRSKGAALSVNDMLGVVTSHLFGGGFNRSSEVSEGASCFSKAATDLDDKRVTDVEEWQKHSVKDPRFVLDVAWKTAGLSVRGLLERQLTQCQLPRDLSSTSELINVLLSRKKRRKERV